jgi:glycosyltransferase involved in cell wall biosynthesis
MMLRFTIITAALNASATIDRSILSAKRQRGEIEHFVIDGGSTDLTLDISRSHSGVEAISAPGSSIYQAWNIGIGRARGDICVFLNSDDELCEGALEAIELSFEQKPGAEIVAGRAVMVDSDHVDRAPVELRAAPSGRLEPAELAFGVPTINAMAFRRSLLEQHGGFENTYRVANDRALLFRLALADSPPVIARTDQLLYRYYCHDGSLTLRRSLRQRVTLATDHMALATSLLAQGLDAPTSRHLRRWRRREAAVAFLRCLAAGRVGSAYHFAATFTRQAAGPRTFRAAPLRVNEMRPDNMTADKIQLER